MKTPYNDFRGMKFEEFVSPGYENFCSTPKIPSAPVPGIKNVHSLRSIASMEEFLWHDEKFIFIRVLTEKLFRG